jgi:hypothetical protein
MGMEQSESILRTEEGRKPESPGRRRFIKGLMAAIALAAAGCVEQPGLHKQEKKEPTVRPEPPERPKLHPTPKKPFIPETPETIDEGTFLNDCKELFTSSEHPHTHIEILSNLKNFKSQAEVLQKSPDGQEFLRGKKELTLLYPGSGVHLSPLEFVYHMANQNSEIQKYSLTYTEVDQLSYDKIAEYLQKIVDKKDEFEDLKVEEPLVVEGKQKLMKFKIKTEDGRTVEVELVFEFKRSGEKWFRKEHLEKADIILSHDMAMEEEGRESPTVAVNIIYPAFEEISNPQKPRLFIMEDRQEAGYRPIMHSHLGKKMIGKADGKFGCGMNHRDWQKRTAMYHQSALYLLDENLLTELSQIPGSLETLAELLTFNKQNEFGGAFESNKFDMQERRNLSSSALIKASEIFKKIKDEKVRKTFAEVVMHYLTATFNFQIFQMQETLELIHDASALCVEDLRKFDILTEAKKVISLSPQNRAQLKELSYPLLATFHSARGTNDKELEQKLAAVIDSLLSKTDPAQIEKTLFNGSTGPMNQIIKFHYSENGLFAEESQIRELGINKLVHDEALSYILTILYIAKELNCPSLEKFRNHFKTGGDTTPGTYKGELVKVL